MIRGVGLRSNDGMTEVCQSICLYGIAYTKLIPVLPCLWLIGTLEDGSSHCNTLLLNSTAEGSLACAIDWVVDDGFALEEPASQSVPD